MRRALVAIDDELVNHIAAPFQQSQCIKATSDLKIDKVTKGRVIGYGKSSSIIEEVRQVALMYKSKYKTQSPTFRYYNCTDPTCSCETIYVKWMH